MEEESELSLFSQRVNMLLQNKLWMSRQMDRLRTEYPDEYVAVDQGRIVGHNKDIAKLVKALRKQFGKHTDHVAIDFVSPKKIELILH